jgi:hypothetical protein
MNLDSALSSSVKKSNHSIYLTSGGSADVGEISTFIKIKPNITKNLNKSKGKGKAIPLHTWPGPEGSRSLRLQDFKTVNT